MRDICPVIAVDHKRRGDKFWSGRVQQPKQEHDVRADGGIHGQPGTVAIGLNRGKHYSPIRRGMVRQVNIFLQRSVPVTAEWFPAENAAKIACTAIRLTSMWGYSSAGRARRSQRRGRRFDPD